MATVNDAPVEVVACIYCKHPCDGTKHDVYGELVLHRTLIVCDECDDDLANETGPWNEMGN